MSLLMKRRAVRRSQGARRRLSIGTTRGKSRQRAFSGSVQPVRVRQRRRSDSIPAPPEQPRVVGFLVAQARSITSPLDLRLLLARGLLNAPFVFRLLLKPVQTSPARPERVVACGGRAELPPSRGPGQRVARLRFDEAREAARGGAAEVWLCSGLRAKRWGRETRVGTLKRASRVALGGWPFHALKYFTSIALPLILSATGGFHCAPHLAELKMRIKLD